MKAKKNIFLKGILIFFALLAVIFTACNSNPELPVITISMQPEQFTEVPHGNITGSLNVIASATQGAAIQYQWFKSTLGNNTQGTMINGATSANFVIPADLEVGTHYFFVLLRANGAASVRSSVATVDVIDITPTITISPSTATVQRGGFQVFSATITPVQPIVWEVTGGGAGTSISSGGLLFIAPDETAASLIVRAVSSTDSSVSDTAIVTIPAIVTGITVSPNAVMLERGQTMLFDATVSGTGNPAETVTWTVSGNSSSGTNITQSGLLTIASNETNVNLTVRAISTVNPGISGTAFVSLYVDDPVQRITFTGNTATVNLRGLVNNNIYLVRVNTSEDITVPAAGTGRVLNLTPSQTELPDPLFSGMELENDGIDRHNMFREFEAKYPPTPRIAPLRGVTAFTPPTVGQTRLFWVGGTEGAVFNPATHRQELATLLATGTYGNIWVVGNSITEAQAQALSDRFDIIYPAATNLLGFEYGKHPGQTPNGMDGDPKIQILVYTDFVSNFAGYFWSKDWRPDGTWGTGPNSLRSNEAEIFYMNGRFINNLTTDIDRAASVLAHELQHMINWNEKRVRHGLDVPAWYNEMLSMMTEDILDSILHPSSNPPPLIAVNGWRQTFLNEYELEGITEWHQRLRSYATKQFFGSYLLRNFGGAELLRLMAGSGRAGTASITYALNRLRPGMNFREALLRYGEALIFSGNQMPLDVLSFDITYEKTVNGIHYIAQRFDIRQGPGSVVRPITPISMGPSSIVVQQANSWRNVSGNKSITLERPDNSQIELILMIR